jgi:hypothetical protein
MSFLNIFSLELASNIPMWLGFMIAVKLFYQSRRQWWQSLLILYFAAIVTSTLVLLVEPIKLGGSTLGALYPLQILALAVVFTVISLPFVWYISTTTPWVSWRSDLMLAALLGVVLTAGEALVVQVFDVRILLLHVLSMAAAAGVTIPVMRCLRCQSWRTAMGGVLAVVIVASVLIVTVEYVPLTAQSGSTTHITADTK